jgi:uncharacterized protein YeaO (DUF488 family)
MVIPNSMVIPSVGAPPKPFLLGSDSPILIRPLRVDQKYNNNENRLRRPMSAAAKRVTIKRVYDAPAGADGTRILVDRLWPRGLTKDRAKVDAWLRDLAPSDALRKWYHSRPDEWTTFRRRYLKELSSPKAAVALEQLYGFAHGRKPLTLLFASRNQDRNNATVIQDLLNGMRKPPTGTGPAGARAARDRQAKRMPRR